MQSVGAYLMHKTPSSKLYRHTSKKPEKGEVEGVHFFFVKKDVMQKMADGAQLAEVGEVPGGSLTGTAAATLHQVLRAWACISDSAVPTCTCKKLC